MGELSTGRNGCYKGKKGKKRRKRRRQKKSLIILKKPKPHKTKTKRNKRKIKKIKKKQKTKKKKKKQITDRAADLNVSIMTSMIVEVGFFETSVLLRVDIGFKKAKSQANIFPG